MSSPSSRLRTYDDFAPVFEKWLLLASLGNRLRWEEPKRSRAFSFGECEFMSASTSIQLLYQNSICRCKRIIERLACRVHPQLREIQLKLPSETSGIICLLKPFDVYVSSCFFSCPLPSYHLTGHERHSQDLPKECPLSKNRGKGRCKIRRKSLQNSGDFPAVDGWHFSYSGFE